MLSRFSVKRPYIIIVAVIVILILGGVSLTKMKTDLLPDMDLPYVAVITTDAGASAEKVESEVTDVLESSLSTVSGVKTVTSQSSNNYSMIFLEFEDGTNIDSAMVKVSSAVNQVASQLPDTAGDPNYMEISADMMATLYVAVQYEGKDIYELTNYTEDKVVPELERVNGVADVSTTGAIDQSVEVRLSDSKIEDINNRLLSSVNDQLYDAKKSIDEGQSQLSQAEQTIKDQQSALSNQESQTSEELGQTSSALTVGVSAATAEVSSYAAAAQAIQSQIAKLDPTDPDYAQKVAALQSQLEEIQKQLSVSQEKLTQYQQALAQVQSGSVSAASQFGSASAQLASAQSSLDSSKSQLEEAQSQYEDSRQSALEQANINALVDKSTLSKLIQAQNFSMPAGYLKSDSDSDTQWLLRVGDNITSLDSLKTLLLTNIDGVGDIRLQDVADITVIDNSGSSYTKLNGKDGVLLSVFKNSTASTSDVSKATNTAIETLEKENPGLTLEVVSDQGSYISTYINTILQSLVLGALLAVVVLIIFLRDWKPTLIVAFSIPFSVLCALLLMYFTGIQLNIMSLGGLSLAIGMLVDNSIIVLENIYRLRGRGIPAARAAVQGAKQITGAVIASTLTTICVFLPIIFTTGIVNQLMMPFALTIAYVLTASLVVALTLVPSVSSLVFKNYKPRKNTWMEKVQGGYERSISFCLKHKVLPLGIATVLFVVAVVGVVNMGVTLIPSMTSKTVNVSVTMPDDADKQTAYKTADDIMNVAMGIDGVETVGAMDGTATLSLVSSSFSSAGEDSAYGTFSFYIKTSDSVTTESQVNKILDELNDKTKDFNCEVITDASSSEAMSSMLGSGLSLTVKGSDKDELIKVSEKVMNTVKEVKGYTKVENGMEDADKEMHLVIDRDKLTKEGYTTAQLYSDLATKLTTETKSTSMELNKSNMVVNVVDETKPVTKDNLLDTTIDITTTSGEKKTIRLGDYATVEEGLAATTITHENSVPAMTVTAEVEDGYNNTILSRELEQKIDALELPDGYSVSFGGEISNVNTMLEQMMLLLILGFILIYLVMVAQFQSMLSPFIIILTVPLAFTGGLLGLLFAGEQLNMLSLMGFAVLMGTVVNNGIVFVDYVNQLRRGGLEKRDALIASGKTRMRPIVMTALTTILAMVPMILSDAVGASMERGMALVIVGGLLYATFMTLYVVPVMYDLLYRRVPYEVDLGDENIDEDPGDAQAYLDALKGAHAAQATAPQGAVATAGAGAGAGASAGFGSAPGAGESGAGSGVGSGSGSASGSAMPMSPVLPEETSVGKSGRKFPWQKGK